MTRAVFSDDVKNNLSLYDEIDIQDGETPEILAYQIYGNSDYHWIILHTNDIIDPRYDWPLTTDSLYAYIDDKYTSRTGIHHYEDTDGNYVNGNVYLNSNAEFSYFTSGTVVSTSASVGAVTSQIDSSNVMITVSTGGFETGEVVGLYSNSSINATITSTVVISGIPVTNEDYEITVNESKRRIKILKIDYLQAIIKDFNSKFDNTNG
jgi:hypothetical protein